MKYVYLVLSSLVVAAHVGVASAQTQRARSPKVGAHNSPPGVLNDTSHVRNMFRQRILNDVIHRRGASASVSAQVYSLSFFSPFWLLWNKWETTFGAFNRGVQAITPFGQKKHYSGLHPRYVEYRFHDKDGDLLYAQCFLHFYTSRAIPGRVFIRSYQCTETEFTRTAPENGTFHFASVVDVVRGKVTNFKDLTPEWSKDGTLDSETKFISVLNDPAVFFTTPRRPPPVDEETQVPVN